MATSSQNEQKNTFVSDQPSPLDYLDFKPYVSGLVDVITARETQTPLTLGISGSWGSGKTTLMQLMEKDVSERVKKGGGRSLKCLWVNVWQVSQHGEGRQALLQALFTKVRGNLGTLRRLAFGWFLLRERVNYSVLLRQLAVNSYRVLIVLAPFVAVNFINTSSTQGDKNLSAAGASALLGLWLILKPLVEAAREKVSLDLGAVLDEVPYEHKVSALQKLQTHFERLVREWVGEDGRLIVFIDDLDRCSPDNIGETLEALKLFATTERCVYVLGLDQDVVARNIQLKYKDLAGEAGDGVPLGGVRYLEKIVQLPFLLPQIEMTDIRGYVNSFNVDWPHGGCADIFVEGLPPNPRQLKRAVNVFFLLWRLAEGRRERLGRTVMTPMRLAKVVALQTAHPDLFEWFKRAPYLLRALELYCVKSPEERKLLEETLEEGVRKRLGEVSARPGLKPLFELHKQDWQARFGDLDPTDLAAFFSLTRSVTMADAGVSASASTLGDDAETPKEQEPVTNVVTGSGNVAPDTIVNAYPGGTQPVSSLHQLPPPPRDFTGRENELKELLSKVESGEAAVCAVVGLGGVGKTAFTLKLAEQLAPRYQDAQFYLDLKGTTEKPLSVAEALSHVIRAFYATSRLPEDESELRSLYRSVLHGRSALIFMDNASGSEQVEPLIPPEGCVLLITSRMQFTLPGIVSVSLDALTPEQSHKLLLKISPRIAEHAEEIARLCDYFPLALRLAASLLAERPDLSPAEYINQLSDERKRLQLVEASLSLSYKQLSPALQKLLRMLAVFPANFDAKGAAAVWRTAEDDDASKDSIGELVKFSLVEWNEAESRYRIRNPVRRFADSRLSEQERQLAVERHAAYYLKVLIEAGRLYLEGGESVLAALALFDAERRNIEEGRTWAESHMQDDEDAARLCSDYARAGENLLPLRLDAGERISWIESALCAAEKLELISEQASHLNNLGAAYADLGETKRAVEFYERALSLARESKDRQSEQMALGNLSGAYLTLGETQRAAALLERQLGIANQLGDSRSQARALADLGSARAAPDNPAFVIPLYDQSLTIARKIGDRVGEGYALGNLGMAYDAMGEAEKAAEYFKSQLAIARELGDRRGERAAHGNLGVNLLKQGEAELALRSLNQSLEIARAMGDRLSEGGALFNIAIAYLDLEKLNDAVSYANEALAIFEQIESPQAEVVRKQIYDWTAVGA